MKEAFDIDALLNNEDEQFDDLEDTSLNRLSLSSSNTRQTDLEMDEEENMYESDDSSIEVMDDNHSTTKTSNEVFELISFFCLIASFVL